MKEAAQSDPSIIVQAPDCPPRHRKWKAARMKGDKYINVDVTEVASKIAPAAAARTHSIAAPLSFSSSSNLPC
ncbi:hypothetical protein K1719_023573 [Acacia pycnantha]|nr:hypothetical protein K1719_023573 [Acacia pycnantha]